MMTRHVIVTRYVGPTGRQGARIVARLGADPRKRVVVSYDYARSASDNHWVAARVLADKLGFANLGFDNLVVSPRESGFIAF